MAQMKRIIHDKWVPLPEQSGAKPKLVAKILATKFGNHFLMDYQHW